MTELKDRLRVLDVIQAPDLRDRIRGWEPRAPRIQPSFKRLGVVLLAFVVAGAGIALAIQAFRATEQPTQPAATIENGRIAFAVGPDADIFVVGPDGTGLTNLVARHARGHEGGVQMAWSPDGTKLAFTDYRPSGSVGLFVMDAEGEAPEDVSPSLELADSPTWSPDGTELAFGGCCDAGYDIYVIGADGTGLRRLTEERDNGVDGAFMPAWSPDGAKIAYSVTRYDEGSQRETHGISIMNADGGNPVFITWSSNVDEVPVWSPDATKIAFLRKAPDGYVDVFVASAVGELTEPMRLSSPSVHATSLPNWAPDSQEVVFSAQGLDNDNLGIYVASTVGGAGERLLLEDAFAGDPVWSPDGGWIAFVRDDAGSGLQAIWLMRPDGTGLTELASGFEEAGGVDWQPLPVPPPADAAVAATMPVGTDGAVRSVAYGEGAVWVAVSGKPAGPGTILRIDPETDGIVATIPVDAVPGWEVGGAGMTIGAGAVWVTGSVEDPSDPPIGTDAVLVRIDPASNEVSATIPLEGERGGDVVVDESGVWVAVGDKEQGELVRIDPATNEAVARIPIPYKAEPYQDLREVVTVDGVVLVNQPTFENGGSAITVVDAATNQVLGTAIIRVPEDIDSSIGPLVAWNGEVWADNGYQLVRIDPRTGQLLDYAVQLPEALAAGLLVAHDRGLWFLGYDGRTGAGPRTLSLFDPATGKVQTFVEVPGIAPNAMAVGSGSVWVLDYHGTLTRIELP